MHEPRTLPLGRQDRWVLRACCKPENLASGSVKQAIQEDVLLRHTPSFARTRTLKSTHHTRSYISCMISKFKKTLLTLSSLALLFFQNVLSRQCRTESGKDGVCDATGLRGTPWEWALVLFVVLPTWRAKWALQNASWRLSPSLSGRTEPRPTQSGPC